MPRYSDQWLIDKTLFDYVQGGSCTCCSFNFLPNGTKGLIESLSELETDAKQQEVNAFDILPWPPTMKDEIWMERVRLRQFCKQQMKDYNIFWKEHGIQFSHWFLHTLTTKHCQRFFQLPRSEILERLKVHRQYQVHAAFGSVLCAVTDQVAHFPLTQYPPDGRGQPELQFENVLFFDRRGGFTLKDLHSESTRMIWLIRHETLGGPTLLARNAKEAKVQELTTLLPHHQEKQRQKTTTKKKKKSSSNRMPEKESDDHDDNDDSDSDEDDSSSSDDDDDDDENNEAEEVKVSDDPPIPSFRSDRRILRLLIARHFADVLQRAYLLEQESHNENGE